MKGKKKTPNKKNINSKKTNKRNTMKKNAKKTQKASNNKKKNSQTAKNEKWYVWLKNNIVENEEKYSKEYKYRRLFVSLFAIFCFFVVLSSTIIIDYTNASKNNEIPYFTIKYRDEYNQVTIYRGLFYKVWKCDNGDTSLLFGSLSSKISYCEIIPKYDKDGMFTNPNKVKFTKSQINIIKDYYFDNYIYFKSQKELENAYELSKSLNKVWWVTSEKNEIINDDESVNLAIFGKTEIHDGVEVFVLQYANPQYYRCVKEVNGINIFSKYNYLDNTCDASWETLSLDKKSCDIVADSTDFIKNLVDITGYCK